MANGDYGYFGKGDTGYAQYMTAFNRNFGGSSGGGGGGNHNNGGGGGGRRQRLRLSHCHCGGGRAGAPRHGKLRASPRCRAACGKRRKKLKKHLTLTLRHSVY